MPTKVQRLKTAEKFYKQGLEPANRIIKANVKESNTDRNTKNDLVIYGSQSMNAQLPGYLQAYTEDWDIYSGSPRAVAKKIEKALDRRYGGNFFKVKLAKHKGTFKIVSTVTGKTVADITSRDVDSIPIVEVDGIDYAALDVQVGNIRKDFKDPKKKFRRVKDREQLQRIQIAGMHKKK